jgi:hypothetical protein
MWSTCIASRAAHPGVPIIFVINPADGPGGSKQASYVSGIAQLKAAGITVIGYVNTDFTNVSIADCEAAVDKYHAWYGIDGIMFDCQGNAASQLVYYETLTAYVKALGMKLVVDNPGTDVPLSFIGASADVLCIYESGGYPPITTLAAYGASPKSNFAYIALSVGFNAAFVTKSTAYVDWVYPTDQGGGNPYTVLPSYWDQLVALLDTGIVPPPPTTAKIAVSAQDAKGAAIPGLQVLLDTGGSQLASGHTPASFVAPVGQNYDAIIQDSMSFAFDHWLDGTTTRDEMLTLNADTALVAVMKAAPVPPPSPALLQINAVDLAGNPLVGEYVSIKVGGKAGYTPLSFTPKVTVIASNWQNNVFQHWEDGSTSAVRVLKVTGPMTLTATYAT